MTVACVTSYHQNVTYPYLIDCGTLRHILLEIRLEQPPHPSFCRTKPHQSFISYGWLYYQHV